MNVVQLKEKIQIHCPDVIDTYQIDHHELTLEVPVASLKTVCLTLRDEPCFAFEQLIDVCGVDYQDYGVSEWATESTTYSGFERAVTPLDNQDTQEILDAPKKTPHQARFAVVYHLLSLKNNHRVRLRCFLSEEALRLPSVNDVWAAANWFEREAYDLFGIVFEDHPDLRRILTDYGFEGHPFRKDFPLIGNVEMHYDAGLQRCTYAPVSIEPRVLVPKVIREQTQAMETAGSPAVQNPPTEEKKSS